MNKARLSLQKHLTKEINAKNLANIILYSVIIIMPFIVVNVSSPRYVIGKLMFLYIVGVISIFPLVKLKFTDFTIEHKISLVFLLTMLIPSMLSPQKYVAFMGNLERGEGFIIFCVYIELFILASKCLVISKRALNLILISSCIMGIYGVFQFYGFDPIQFWMFSKFVGKDSVGLIGNRNFFSTYICLFLFISMALYIFKGKKEYFIYSSILFAALLCTLTRSGWVAFIIYSFLGIVLIINKKDRLKKAANIFIIFSAIFLILNTSTNNKVLGRANNTISIDENGNRIVQDSGRIDILKISWTAFKDSPIIGWGPDTLKYRLDSEYSDIHLDYIINHNTSIDKSHNEYLEYAVSNGIFNLIAYLTLIGVIIYKLIRRKENDIFKVLLLTLVGYLVQGFFNISVIMVAPIYWIFLGYCVKLINSNIKIVK